MFEALLTRVAQQLEGAGLPYMVIGDQAVLLYGEPRLTKDIDVTLGATLDRLPEVLELVEAMGLEPLVDPEQFTRETMVLPCRDPGTEVRVDLIFSYSPYERQALERARPIELAGDQVRFASLEDVIIHKVIAGRPRDMEDVKGMLIKNPGADIDYVRSWLQDFADSLNERFQERFEQVLDESR
jgi:predicted nucleotidyltransferase